ncbi:hypothetical protein C4D23_10380 [Clostridium perfringens]|uniref:toxin C-terminal domain-containing protein n=1 Tax=Clostridium perfringens TaxID=1502 RepID=UPI0028632414|nr:hypothetical protein [Clostridium perfringens]ELC8380364.1 hypothetical protein [Clostridium perfringens]
MIKNKYKNNNTDRSPISRIRNKDLEKIADKLGFSRINFRTKNGQVVFKQKITFISYDISSHHSEGF